MSFASPAVMEPSTKRFWTGAACGAVATAVMTVAMSVIASTGLDVLPEPAPFGILARIVARLAGLPSVNATANLLAIPIHLAYGAIWAGLLAEGTSHVTVAKGILLGLGLWLVMMIFFVPMGGGYTFDMATRPGFWLSTLVLHLIYGASVGMLVDRPHPREIGTRLRVGGRRAS